MGVGEVLGEAGTGDSAVEFIKVNGLVEGRRKEDRGEVGEGRRARGGGKGPGVRLRIGGEEGGGALGGREVEAVEEEGLDDGAVVGNYFDMCRRKGIEVDGGAEFNHDGAGAGRRGVRGNRGRG